MSVLNESVGRRLRPLTDRERRDQLRVLVNGDENVLVADARVVGVDRDAALLHAAERPDFIALQMT
jgi:CMP-2-keto-3-deoxyoctulosonic acid synthetase